MTKKATSLKSKILKNLGGATLKHQLFKPETGKVVPVGKVVYKRAGNCIVKMLVTKAGLVPRGFNSPNQAPLRGKFRVAQVLVLGIVNGYSGNPETTATSSWNGRYIVGELYNPDGFTTNLNEDCGHGVHCFANVDKIMKWMGTK